MLDIVGHVFDDAEGRSLHVTEYNPGDPLGRDIVGKMYHKPQPGKLEVPIDYATTVQNFQTIWLDKAERWKSDEEKNRAGKTNDEENEKETS